MLIVSCWPQNYNRLPNDASTKKTFKGFIVILILTGPKNFDRRDVIRETWLSDTPEDIIKYFVIGTKGMPPEQLGTLKFEQSKHEDLLLLPELKDSYFNLTAKVVESFTWLKEHVDFDFVFKGDDDTYVRLDVLHKELQGMKPERTYWGFFDGRGRVKKSGQWAEKDWILCDRYLPHAKGGGYLLSSDLVKFIADSAHLLKQFNSEDVSVGTWLAGLDIQRIHDHRFDTEYISRGCSNEYIVTHKQDTKMMKEKHLNLKNLAKLCTREIKSRDSYIYNWDVPPSMCCIRNNSKIP